jgi:hypothetical protein
VLKLAADLVHALCAIAVGVAYPVAPEVGFLSILQTLGSVIIADFERMGFASLIHLGWKGCLAYEQSSRNSVFVLLCFPAHLRILQVKQLGLDLTERIYFEVGTSS